MAASEHRGTLIVSLWETLIVTSLKMRLILAVCTLMLNLLFLPHARQPSER